MFKVSKKHSKTTCQIYQKLAIKTPERHLVLLLLTLYFALYCTVKIVELEQANAGWAWEKVVSDNKFVFSNCKKYNVLWAGKFVRLYFLRLQKDQVSRRHFRNVSQTLNLIDVFMFNTLTKLKLKSCSHLPKNNFFCFNKCPLKIMKNAFHFILKTLVFALTFWSCRKNDLIRKIRLNSKFVTPRPG